MGDDVSTVEDVQRLYNTAVTRTFLVVSHVDRVTLDHARHFFSDHRAAAALLCSDAAFCVVDLSVRGIHGITGTSMLLCGARADSSASLALVMAAATLPFAFVIEIKNLKTTKRFKKKAKPEQAAEAGDGKTKPKTKNWFQKPGKSEEAAAAVDGDKEKQEAGAIDT